MNTINNRIKLLIDHFADGNNSLFANKIGVSEANVRNYIKTTEPKFSTLENIVKTFEINYEWLLTGKGDMLKKDDPLSEKLKILDSIAEVEEPITEYIQKENNTIGVPYYENMEVAGGITTMYSDFKEVPTFYINYEHFNDCTAYLPVVGDSMYPQYCSGEIVAVKRIINYNALLWGEAYFIVTNSSANDLKTIKLLFSHEDDSKLILRASNPNYKGDTIIDKCDIIHIYSVKGKIKRNQL